MTNEYICTDHLYVKIILKVSFYDVSFGFFRGGGVIDEKSLYFYR